MRLFLALFPLAALAQPGPGPAVLVTYTHQPLETFKAAFLSKLSGVALYKATSCNQDFVTTGSLSSGVVLQAADSVAHIGTVDKALVEATVLRARHHSKKYIAAETLLWGVLLGAAAWPEGGVATAWGHKIPWLAILGVVSKRASDVFSTSGVSVASLAWLDPNAEVKLSPRACSTGLFLGTWDKRNPITTATAIVTAVAVH